jgi:hypothetical protein
MTKIFEKRMVGAYIKATFPKPWYHQYKNKPDTPEYFKEVEKEMINDILFFEEFIRDHRSQDLVQMEVVREYKNYCQFCGYEFPDNFEGIADCCDEVLEAQKVEIVNK